jgi:addiction module HigA family antidote
MPAEPLYQTPTPGEHLRKDVIGRLGITQDQLAEAMGVSRHSVNLLINDKRNITAEMALRLATVLGTSVEFWLDLQRNVDLERAQRQLADILPKLKVLRTQVRPPLSLEELIGS